MPFRWSNVQDANGIVVAILGMTIVFSALIVISLAITVLPRILEVVSPFLPHQAEEPHDGPPPAESTAGDEQKVIAAIGFVLHTEMQKAMKR